MTEAEYQAYAIDKNKLENLLAQRDDVLVRLSKHDAEVAATKLTHDVAITELKANHDQIVLAKDADLTATRGKLASTVIVRDELQSMAAKSIGVIADRDTEIIRLKAAFNPPLPTPVIGTTKTVSITVDATAWDGILASIYDSTLDIPAEKQATDFILSQYAGKFVAWAEKENFKPIEAQVEQAKQQIKEATSARAIEVLASTKVTIE